MEKRTVFKELVDESERVQVFEKYLVRLKVCIPMQQHFADYFRDWY